MPDSLPKISRDVTACTRCPRLRTYCQTIATEKRRAFADWTYWGLPVPGFGDPDAAIWIVGLAPAAHGANRTGRVFTGDRSGDFLFAALHRAGLASQPASTHRADGLRLRNVYISAAVRCAPPDNKPLPVEITACAQYLDREWFALRRCRVLLALGKIAWDACLALARRHQTLADKPAAFAHDAVQPLGKNRFLLGSYHVSQQNTFTGRLTPAMFDHVVQTALKLGTAQAD